MARPGSSFAPGSGSVQIAPQPTRIVGAFQPWREDALTTFVDPTRSFHISCIALLLSLVLGHDLQRLDICRSFCYRADVHLTVRTRVSLTCRPYGKRSITGFQLYSARRPYCFSPHHLDSVLDGRHAAAPWPVEHHSRKWKQMTGIKIQLKDTKVDTIRGTTPRPIDRDHDHNRQESRIYCKS